MTPARRRAFRVLGGRRGDCGADRRPARSLLDRGAPPGTARSRRALESGTRVTLAQLRGHAAARDLLGELVHRLPRRGARPSSASRGRRPAAGTSSASITPTAVRGAASCTPTAGPSRCSPIPTAPPWTPTASASACPRPSSSTPAGGSPRSHYGAETVAEPARARWPPPSDA